MLTSLLPRPLLDKLRSNPVLYSKIKSCVNHLRRYFPVQRYDGLPGGIHPNDFMLRSYSASGKAQYLRESYQQFEVIEEALRLAGRDYSEVGGFLDLGAGYGRILRWVVEKISPSKITACDLNLEAVNFCVDEFACTGIVTDHNFSRGDFKTYDLIFSCSVLTHLTAQGIEAYFKKVSALLESGGLLIFSLHGNASIEAAKSKVNSYLDPDIIRQTLSDTGFFYMPYPHYVGDDLGDTFFTVDFLLSIFASNNYPLKLVSHIAGPTHGWLHDWIILKKD